MFYVFSHIITTGDIITAPKKIVMDLTTGVIHQVDLLFQDGCNHKAGVQVWQGDQQLWPTNRGAYAIGNATVISFREFFELRPGANDLEARIWGDGTITGVQVIVQIGMLPKELLQPLSFEALLAAATGV